jgi:transcriptional regulator with XRE-family HTH domain
MAKMFPVIDLTATGENIIRLRKARGLTVRDLQDWFGFEEPQAIYKWQKGKSLPTVDNLYALGALLDVPMEEILVPCKPQLNIVNNGQQEVSCCPPLLPGSFEYGRTLSPCYHFIRLLQSVA